MTSTATAEIRREVVFSTLQDLGGWRAPAEISARLKEESLLPHAPALAGDYVFPWTAYSDLLKLEKEGRVERHWINARVVWWRPKS